MKLAKTKKAALTYTILWHFLTGINISSFELYKNNKILIFKNAFINSLINLKLDNFICVIIIIKFYS